MLENFSFSTVTGSIGTIWMIYVSWKMFRYFTNEKINVSLDKHRNRKNTIVIGHLSGGQSLLKSVVSDKDESISIDTYEEVSNQLKEIKKVSGAETDIEIVLHTPGGSLFYSQLIANMIHHWKGKTTAHIVGYSASGGTLIALACDKIIMSEESALGPIDPQINSQCHTTGIVMAISMQDCHEMFTDPKQAEITDKNLMIELLKRHTQKLIPIYNEFIDKLLAKNYPDELVRIQIRDYFMSNQAHCLPIFYETCRELHLNVILGGTSDTSDTSGTSGTSGTSDTSGTSSKDIE